MRKFKMHRNAKTDLFGLAGQNRKASTQAEEILWECLRNKRFMGFKFRRQHPIADFIVDFFCAECNLGVEVDGEYHNEQQQQMKDKKRTEELNKLKTRIIRFTNHEVIANTELVLKQLEQYLTTP